MQGGLGQGQTRRVAVEAPLLMSVLSVVSAASSSSKKSLCKVGAGIDPASAEAGSRLSVRLRAGPHQRDAAEDGDRPG